MLAPLIVGPIGAPELLIVLAIVVVLFGATRIGDIGKGMGRGIREFRHEVKEGQEEDSPKKAAESTTAASTKVSSTEDKRPQTH